MVRPQQLTGVVLVLLAAWLGAAAATFLDAIVLDATWRVTGIGAAAIVLVGLSLFGILGRPWRRWSRTPYW